MTENKFEDRQLEGYRKMSGAERIRIAFGLNSLVREVARAGIKVQHPEFDPDQIETELQRRIGYGRTTNSLPDR